MSIQVIGSTGTIAEVDGTTWRALRVTVRPIEYGLRGQYRLGVQATAGNKSFTNASLFQARWFDPNAVALIWGFNVDGPVYTGSSSAGFGNFQLFFARNYTANGSGGTTLTPISMQDLRMTMRQSLMADMRMTTTAALTAGTWVLDSQPLGQYVFSVPGAVTGGAFNVNRGVLLYGCISRVANPAPIVLGFNEGINLRGTMNITGGGINANFGLNMTWSEVSIY